METPAGNRITFGQMNMSVPGEEDEDKIIRTLGKIVAQMGNLFQVPKQTALMDNVPVRPAQGVSILLGIKL